MWRLLELGEVVAEGDEWLMSTNPRSWVACSNLIGQKVSVWVPVVRRKLPETGCADIGAHVPDPGKSSAVVSVDDIVRIESGTWQGCTGRVIGHKTRINLPVQIVIWLDNVFAGGLQMSVFESADNVTVLPEPVVDPEWRLLEIGEVIREGDQVYTAYWTPAVGSVGREVGTPLNRVNACRRRVRIQSPGWRWLDIGETVQSGDEFCTVVSRIWRPVVTGGYAIKYDDLCLRRKTVPFAG